MAFGDVTLGLEGEVAVGAAAGCPTEEEVTCKMEAAEFEKIAPQSAVGDSSGLVGLENQKNRFKCCFSINVLYTMKNFL